MMQGYHRNVRDLTKRANKAYFGIKYDNQDKIWALHKVCKNCTDTLCFWTKGKVKIMRFGVPAIWWESTNHRGDRYFCTEDMTGWNRYKKNT